MPCALIEHVYSRRDRAARRALARAAAEVLREAGAALTYHFRIRTFSHALGTVRMGDDPARSALDPYGAFRGAENLHVADASVFPTGGAVNPSLTVAATALRSAEHIAGSTTWRATSRAPLVQLRPREVQHA
jgi:choline dehydrogenase-like flavoprotein